MIPIELNLKECCVVHVVLDSCTYSSARKAQMMELGALGPLREADAVATYTPVAHPAMWLGHLPTTVEPPHWPYYCETKRQLWRILTGRAANAERNCGQLFAGSNIIDSWHELGLYVLGVGGVTQFTSKTDLITKYRWSQFEYFGPDLDEERMHQRQAREFPLNHIDWIVQQLRGRQQWVLFINSPESHYPYDWGKGFPEGVTPGLLGRLKKVMNQRSRTVPQEELQAMQEFGPVFRQMQIQGLKEVDRKLGLLFAQLRQITSRPIYVVVCGDHGESFGELYKERPHFGHLLPAPPVMSVPLWMGVL